MAFLKKFELKRVSDRGFPSEVDRSGSCRFRSRGVARSATLTASERGGLSARVATRPERAGRVQDTDRVAALWIDSRATRAFVAPHERGSTSPVHIARTTSRPRRGQSSQSAPRASATGQAIP